MYSEVTIKLRGSKTHTHTYKVNKKSIQLLITFRNKRAYFLDSNRLSLTNHWPYIKLPLSTIFFFFQNVSLIVYDQQLIFRMPHLPCMINKGFLQDSSLLNVWSTIFFVKMSPLLCTIQYDQQWFLQDATLTVCD